MNQYGSARKWLPSVCFFQFPGSLFFSRKVLIEPRFEVHLKAAVDAIIPVENVGEQKIYGFTMVVSGYKNTISGLEGRSVTGNPYDLKFTDIGYNGFTNALIIEFDFVQDYYDPDTSSFSIRYCGTSCSMYDNSAIVSKGLSQQRYTPGQKNSWDFRLVYADKTFYLYSGPNVVLHQMSIDLEATLGTNIAFVGFTGFMESNRGEINIFGSFICEDNYLLSKMKGAFYESGKTYSEKTYEPGQTINYAFNFINNQNKLVPHTYGYGIWDYSFFITQDCGTKGSYSITKSDNYTLILSIQACTKVGKHSININEDLKGAAPLNYYTVVPGPLNKINLVGHDGVIGTVPLKSNTDSFFLNFGTSNSGDFIFKYDLNIILDLSITDAYGNAVTVSNPTSLFTLKKVNSDGSTTNVNDKILKYTMAKNGDYYQITLVANQTGTFQIDKNEYMERPIKFKVIPDEPSSTKSYCSLVDYSANPTVKKGTKLKYKCFLIDQYGNDITLETFIPNSKYDFTCEIDKTWPSTARIIPILNNGNSNDNYYMCEYTTSVLGNFAFNGYLRLKKTRALTKITAKINQFYVRGYANTYIIKKIYNPSTNKWIDIGTTEDTKIQYKTDSSSLVTALDFAEADGNILISEYVNYPDDFKITDLTCELYSPHDTNFKFVQPSIRTVSMGGRSYIGIYVYDVSNTGRVIVKSNFEYYLKFKYLQNSEKSAAAQYIPNISPYVTCFHPLDLTKTKISIPDSVELLIKADEAKIGSITLSTTDGNLYNYDIGIGNFSFKLEISVDIQFRLVALSIEGTYDVYAKSNEEYQGDAQIIIKNQVVKTIRIQSGPPQACYINWLDSKSFSHIKTEGKELYFNYIGNLYDGNLLIQYKLLDKYNNTIANSEYYTKYADISSEEYGTDKTYFTIEYNKDTTSYKFTDNIPYEDKIHGWVFTTRERTCNYKYYVRYDGKYGGSPLEIKNSYFNIINNNIDINKEAYVEVIYKDKNNQLLGLQKGKLNDLISVTEVSAYKDGKKQVILNYESITSNYALRYKATFTDSGVFTIVTTYNKAELNYENTNKLTVIDTIYSLAHSNLKMIVDSIIDMTTDVRVTIENTLYEPIFKLYFYTKENKKTTYDKNINFSLRIPVGKTDEIKLQQNKNNDQFVEFTFPKDELDYFHRLSKGNYNLELSDGKETLIYQLYLISDNSTDHSNDRNYNIDFTEVSPTSINGVAGKFYTINVEFRGTDSLRWNGDIELSDFKAAYTQTFKNANEFDIKIEKGSKSGQVAIIINQTIITNNEPNIISFKYKGVDISKKVSLTIKCGELKNLILINGPTLGDVTNPPKIIFKPVDSYNNLYSDLFASTVTQSELDAITVGTSKDNIALTSKNTVSDGQYLNVQYISKVSTDVIVTSEYSKNSYEYRIYSGPIDKDISYAEIKSSTTNVGEEYVLLISPKDIYNNYIDGLNEDDVKQFKVIYKTVDGTFEKDVDTCYLVERSSSADIRILWEEGRTLNNYTNIECKANITKAGFLQFVVKYKDNIISCKNQCTFMVIPTSIYFKNIKTLYTNKNAYLTTTEANTVEIITIPIFEVSFYDYYHNQLDEFFVNNIPISATLVGTEVKLCSSNNGKTKSITVCPSSNGDDNENIWKYLTNGENYRLNIQNINTKEIIGYPITLTGGSSDGSSDPVDLTKTNFDKTELNLIAGEEDKVTITLMTANYERKNYWYPEPNEKIKMTFAYDSATCTSNAEKADLPGKYYLKVTCTKATTFNRISIIIGDTTLDQKITLTVKSNVAYSLEVKNTNQFIVSSDKYTWTKNPSNDDTITFSYLFKDKYQNILTDDIRELNQYTITSETFSSNKQYYDISKPDDTHSYTFTDKITQVITKHTWNIIISESNRKYSFIYTKIPGVPDYSKSYWTIDKDSYILKETSTINVYLVDKLGVNLGTESERLNNEKGSVTVVANKENDISYTYNSLTSTYIKYIHAFEDIGTYKISVKYKGKLIGQEKNIIINYQTVDLKSSKLYYNIDNKNDNPMSISTQTNINNLNYYPYYKFYFYTVDGTKITLYDKDATMSCAMTYGSVSWKMEITKLDEYIKLTYTSGFEEKFPKLPMGLYYIEISYKNEISKYPIYLLGEMDVSPSNDYDLSKIYIKPNEIEALAGEEKEVEIEFRASDGLRWNYEVNLLSFGVSNSYGLKDPSIQIRVGKGEKNGQIKLYVTQTVATTGKDNNILQLTYASKTIPQTISLIVKSSALKSIKYISGIEDGTVVSPPIGKFIPYDEYGNICTQVFDKSEYSQEKLNQLTAGASVDGYDVTKNIYVGDGYLYVQYGCQKITTIKITSEYFTETYTYKLLSGPIDSETSYAQIVDNKGVIAGDISTLNIYPKDKYGNDVSSIIQTDLSDFEAHYNVDGSSSVTIMNNCKIVEGSKIYITCPTTITKSGDVKFGVDYNDKVVKCTNCEFKINPNTLDFSKTKVVNKNTNKEMSKTTINVVSVRANPLFELSFYDKYMNAIIDNTEIEKLNVNTKIEITDVKLCVTNSNLIKLSQLCESTEEDENEQKWNYVPNGENYQLVVYTSTESLIYPVQITGGYSDGSSGPIDVSKTYINPTELTLTAGVEGSVDLEIRTESNIRKNYWFENIAAHLGLKFQDNDHNCVNTIIEGAKPGQYILKFTCTKTKNLLNAVVTLENTEVPTKINIKVIPNEPASSKLFYMDGTKIEGKELESVSVESKLQLINELYDKYGNIITNINFDLSILKIKIAPSITVKNYEYSAETVAQNTGKVIITLKSTYAGEHILVGALLPLESYTIKFTHGVANADNSILEVSQKEALAGQTVEIYITPYDKYFNLIDAKEYLNASPYQVKYTNNGDATKVIMQAYTIKAVNNINVLSYPGAFYVRGYTNFYGYIDTAPIKCVSCRIDIQSTDIKFDNTLVMRYELSKNDYELLKNGITEKNTKEEPIYRLYPRDEYSNTIDFIPDDKLNNYQAQLIAQNEDITYDLLLNNKGKTKQQYAEFVKNDKPDLTYTYATLTKGFYTLLFTDGSKTLNYNISLLGDEYGGSNEEADYEKTHINEQNLNFLAGESGYIVLEIRTHKNVRKKYWNYDIKVESCDEKDTTFSAVSNKAGLIGVFQITITTQKANTYPKLVKCPLKIYINNTLVQSLSPEMEVSPNAVVKTTILDKYYKPNSDTELKEGNSDSNYIFELSSFDQYNNLAKTVQETIGLKVSLKGEEITKVTSETNIETGYRKYSVTATKSGTYIVSTSKSGPQGIYLRKEASFLIGAGNIDLTKTIIKEKATPIQAGDKPVISISAYDQYGNALDYDNYMNSFTAVFIDTNNNKFESTPNYDSNSKKVYYTSDKEITIAGEIKVEVLYNKENKIDTSNIIIEVIPGDPYPPYSILSQEINTGEYAQYYNQNKIEIDTTKALVLNMTLYDKYKNYVNMLPAAAKVLNPIMSGNKMKEIKFNVIKNTGNFDLDFNGNAEYSRIYRVLVKGIYDLTLSVQTNLGESKFAYKLEVVVGDELHGNGDIVISKCVLSPSKVSFIAGNYQKFTLELRTEEGLLYNDDIDTNKDLKVYKESTDDSFQYSVVKAGESYGIYTITIYSEKKGNNKLNVELNSQKLTPVEYTVTPDPIPDKNNTRISLRPNDEVGDGELQYIRFSLYDKFDNSIEKSDNIIDINYFTLLDNETMSAYSSFNFESNTELRIAFMTKYPPKKMILNLFYNNGETSVYIFENNIEITIKPNIDYGSTSIVSSNKEKINAGDFLDMWLYTVDKNGNCLDNEDYSSQFKIEVKGPLDTSKQYVTTYQVTKTKISDKDSLECNNEYNIVTKEEHRYKYAGNYLIKVYARNNLIAQYNQVCYPLGYSLEGFNLKYSFNPNEISILDSPSFTITGTDKYGNEVNEPLYEHINIKFTQNDENTEFKTNKKLETAKGTLNYEISIHKVGGHKLHILYQNQEVPFVNTNEPLPTFNILTGPCYAEDNTHFDLNPLNDTEVNLKTHFTFYCYDYYGNKINKGGETFKATANYENPDIQGIVPLDDPVVIDNGDGSYDVEFTPTMKGTYKINLLVRKEKYGEMVVYELKEFSCSGIKNIACPNKKLCVSNILDCIGTKGNCTIDKPFYCKVNDIFTCTKSQIDCDCPKGYIKCPIMKYCVPELRTDMCPKFKSNVAMCMRNKMIYNYDGICRKEDSGPNQRVCPIGKVLCADLSCRDSYDECVETPVLSGLAQRCIGQQIVNSADDCPSSITCPSKDQVVCPTDECVDNEIECPGLTKCNVNYPYLCQNDVCAESYEACAQTISCGENKLLCPDSICRETC